MTYRRSIITRGKLLYQQRFSSSFVCIRRDDDRKDHHSFQECPKDCTFMHLRPFGSTINNSTGFSTLLQQRGFAVAAMSGSLLRRNMSTAIGEGATEKIDYVADVADVLTETTAGAVASQAQVVNEVAVAAADSFFPVAGLQYFMDYIHSLTGLDWWATIVVSTLLIRAITVPLMISQLKSSAKLNLLMPQMEEIKEEINNRGMSPVAVAEGQKKMKALFNKNGVNQFSPLKGILFQGPIFVSFFFAISNMVEKVPSFKEGGAFWFTDLTTPDSLYIFPVLTGLTFWLTVECNTQEGMEGNPSSGTIKNISRGFAALSIPLTSGFPKAIFCYWITSSVFSFAYGLVIKKPAVKKFLGVPIITVHQQRASTKPGLSFFEALKKYAAATKKHQSSSPIEPLKSVNRQISSNSILNQRLRSLEKEVKGRKRKGRRS